MKHNKKTYITALCVWLAGLTLSSCNDWLDVQPESQVEDSEMFNSESGFKETLAGVYSSMVSDNTYTKNLLFGAMDVLAQVWTNYPTSQYQDMADYNYTATYPSSIISGIWATQYNSIANVNHIINNIDSKKNLFSSNNYSIIKGEALALRAFLHFDLLRCFGVSYEVNPDMMSIPYCTELTYHVFPQESVKAVAAKIEADLSEAETFLANDPIRTGETITELDDNGYLMNRQVHLNYYAVKALQARLYMWTHDYDKAAAAAEVVINSGKFEWSSLDNISVGHDYAFADEQVFALNDVNLSTLQTNYFSEDNNSTSFSLDQQNLLDYYDNMTQDYRYLYLWQSGTKSDLISYRYLLKYDEATDDDDDLTYYNNKIPLIRLSEMYLILSECRHRTSGDALEPLNALRVARGLGKLDALPADYYTSLISEYRKEFIGEGQLFFLYKRLNRASVVGSDTDMIGEKAYTFPIPVSETDAAQRESNR